MTCPHCQHVMTCPCAACQEKKPSTKPDVWAENGMDYSCGNCGETKNANDWADIEWSQYEILRAAKEANEKLQPV